MMTQVEVPIGLLCLFLGRKLFWGTVGCLGFLAGLQYAATHFPHNDGLINLIVAIVCGIAGSALAATFEWAEILLMGFLGGGYFLMNAVALIAGHSQPVWWLFVLGGFSGVCVVAANFDAAIIVISSLVGALLTTQALPLQGDLLTFIFICALALGILVQSLTLKFTSP